MSSSAFKGADVSDRLDRAIDNALADNRLVGTVVIVARGGKIAYRRAAGFADRESQKPMQTDSIFRFASVTKPFVTAAVMRLIEDGVVRLDDPVTRFLPDFQPRLSDGSVPVISIRHLLTHTSGLGYPFQEGSDGHYRRLDVSDGLDQPGLSLSENLRRLAAAPLTAAPGSGFRYSLGMEDRKSVV